MKILHVIDSEGLYGAEVVLLNLVAEQLKLGLHPTICSIGELDISEKPLEAEALKRGFEVKKFRMRPGLNIMGALKILRFAHREHFDLIHSHGYKGNIFFGFIPKWFRKITLVSTLHGWTHTGGLNRMKAYEWLDAKSLRYTDAVVVVNRAMLTNPRFKNQNGINLFAINNGIPPHDSTLSPNTLDRKIINFCQQGFTVGSIGRLSTEKGFDYLIEAVHRLIKKGVDLKLIIIGEGSKRNDLQQKINNLNLSDKVFLPGYREGASQYLPFFDLFVLSSLTEGLPITLLEAMQAEIPIVATKVGGISEVLQNGRGGLLVKSSNPEELADSISYIYHNTKLAEQFISFSYNELIAKYTSETMSVNYLNIYQKTIDTFRSTTK